MLDVLVTAINSTQQACELAKERTSSMPKASTNAKLVAFSILT